MRIISLSDTNEHVAAQEVADVIRQGGVAAIPTDTVYGLIGLADRPEAIQKMFTIKKRPKEKAFPVFIRDVAMVRRYAYISDAKARMLERVWPGAVTVIFHHKEKLPLELTAGGDKIAVRIPNNQFLRLILSRFDVPLSQTSANISGKPPAKNMDEIKGYFEGSEQPDIAVDAGEINGSASTIIDFTGSDPVMVRMGGDMKEFEELVKRMRGERSF
jgi:L-threonylcarbamoyladenylate synthase